MQDFYEDEPLIEENDFPTEDEIEKMHLQVAYEDAKITALWICLVLVLAGALWFVYKHL